MRGKYSMRSVVSTRPMVPRMVKMVKATLFITCCTFVAAGCGGDAESPMGTSVGDESPTANEVEESAP